LAEAVGVVEDREDLAGVAARLAPHPRDPEGASRDVFSLLAHAIDSGEAADVIDQSPGGIKDLWPKGVRKWSEARAHRQRRESPH
jgi:hypothetical protein